MPNDKTRYQLLLERLNSDPALKDRMLNATPEEFLTMCSEHGLKIEADKAKVLLDRLKDSFSDANGELSFEQLESVAGGVDCMWGDCGSLECC